MKDKKPSTFASGWRGRILPKNMGKLPKQNTGLVGGCLTWTLLTSISSQIPAISFWDEVLQSPVATNWNTFQITQLSLTLRRFNMTRRCLCTSKNNRSNTLWSLFFDYLAPCFLCHWAISWYLLKAVVQQYSLYSIQVNYQVRPPTTHIHWKRHRCPNQFAGKHTYKMSPRNPMYMKSTSISF